MTFRLPRSLLLRACAQAAAWVFLLALGFGPAMPVAAAPKAEERRVLLDQGKQHRIAGDENEALRCFQRAHALGATPESFALMAAAEYNLNKAADAEPHLVEALRAQSDPWIARHRPELEKLLATVKSVLGWLDVSGSPLGAEVEVAGRAIGRLPLAGPVRVTAGQVNLRLASPGYKVARRDVEVSADETVRVIVDLAPDAALTPPPGGGIVVSPPQFTGAVPPPPPPPPSAGSRHHTAGLVSAGVAVALTATGVGALFVRESATNSFNDERDLSTKALRCNGKSPNAGGGPCQGYLDRMQTAKVTAYVAFAGAGLAAIVSGILLSAGPAPAEGHAAQIGAGAKNHLAAVTCLPAVPGAEGSGFGAACHVSF